MTGTTAARIRYVGNRLYSDFLLPERLDEFRNLITTALEHGYEFYSISGFWQLLQNGSLPPASRIMILRHDIDTDLSTARQLWHIVKKLGVKASYYFRLSTLDTDLMKEIHRHSSEASYHFEEISTYGKRWRLRTAEEIEAHLPKIREEFLFNLRWIRVATKLPLDVVASHDDWHNRRTGIINTRILADQETRRKGKIALEACDGAFMRHVTSQHSDMGYPTFWKYTNPHQAILRGEQVVYVRVHPRYWRANIAANLTGGVKQAWEEMKFFL